MTAAFWFVKSRTLSILLILLTGVFLSSSLHSADKKKMTVVDYFLRLPDKTLEGSAESWLEFLKQPRGGMIDIPNGYMRCTDDGAQPEFEVALFRYRDGRPLLALCEGELEGADSLILAFFEMSSDGKMHKVPRSIFPVGNSLTMVNDQLHYENWEFQLPRHGKTIVVRKQKGGKILHKITWNGEKFVEQRDAASN
jgi:hypothetical protein